MNSTVKRPKTPIKSTGVDKSFVSPPDKAVGILDILIAKAAAYDAIVARDGAQRTLDEKITTLVAIMRSLEKKPDEKRN